MRALQESGFRGGIYPVNPAGGELLGLPVTPSVEDLQEAPDLALICTPASSLPSVLEACAGIGVPGAVVLAVGFRESGDVGAALESELVEISRTTGIRIVGPNTSGVLNTSIGLNLVGVRDVPAGGLSVISQSGNIGLALMRLASARSQGISVYVGVGNEADVAFHEYLEYMCLAPHTAAILMYVEGFKDGEAFLEVARRHCADKPIAVLKGGRSEVGSAAVRSHTGAVAGSAAVLRAALEEAGVHLVERSDELLAIGETLAGQPPAPVEKGVVILSDGGGYGALAADSLSEAKVQLAAISDSTKKSLASLLGPAAAVSNPVDVAGAADGSPEIFAQALEIIADDPATGGVLMVGLFGGYAVRFAEELADEEAAAADAIAEVAARARIPLVVQSMYTASCPEPLARLGRRGVPCVESLETAAACMRAASQRAAFLSDRKARVPPPKSRPVEPPMIAAARNETRQALTEREARELIGEYGVEVAPAEFCRDVEEVRRAISEAGSTVAVKVVSSTILHKSDAGGVVLHVDGPDEGERAYERMLESAMAYAERHNIEPDISGVLVSPMLPAPIAELLVGARRDADFGPVITVGAGGLAVELWEDASLRLLPIAEDDAERMLAELRLAPLLGGYRGGPAACQKCVVEVILGVARCVLENPSLSALEANPVFVYPSRAVAVDVRGLLTDIGRHPRSSQII